MTTAIATTPRSAAVPELPVRRLNLMRAGYLFMAVGLVLVKWPLLPGAHDLPLYEGVTVCMLTAMSLLALLGLRHPSVLLPVLLFETAWKVLWLSLVALPEAATGGLDPDMAEIAFNCTFVIVIVIVVPWRYAWQRYVRVEGERWR
jgi:hypothetical protein